MYLLSKPALPELRKPCPSLLLSLRSPSPSKPNAAFEGYFSKFVNLHLSCQLIFVSLANIVTTETLESLDVDLLSLYRFRAYSRLVLAKSIRMA